MADTLNITVFGTGAMASLFGCLLSDENAPPPLLFGTWREQIDAVRANGMQLVHLDGRKTTHRLRMTDEIKSLPETGLALILVKSHQTQRTAQLVAQVLRKDGLALTLQNGLGNIGVLREHLGKNRTALGITSHGATIVAPGTVRHGGVGITDLGSDTGNAKRLEQVAQLFNERGIVTELHGDTDSLLWGKLLVNAAINPLTALLEVRNGELLENPDARQTMRVVAEEICEVAAAQGTALAFDDPIEQVFDICRATAANTSSMLQDIRRGAVTEIDAITGAVLQHAERLGVPVPVNAYLYRQVKAKETGEKRGFKFENGITTQDMISTK